MFDENVKDTHTEEYGSLDLFASFQAQRIHQAYGFHQPCGQNVANKANVWVSFSFILGLVCEPEPRVWSEVRGLPSRRSTLDARCHWLQSGSSPSLTPHSLSTLEQRGGRSPCNNKASLPFLGNLGQE